MRRFLKEYDVRLRAVDLDLLNMLLMLRFPRTFALLLFLRRLGIDCLFPDDRHRERGPLEIPLLLPDHSFSVFHRIRSGDDM